MWDVARYYGKTENKMFVDFIFQAGGGTHAHDLGTFGGAKSLAQARDAILNGESAFETIGKHFETLSHFENGNQKIRGMGGIINFRFYDCS